MNDVFSTDGWTVIGCHEAHPGQSCSEYEAWLDRIEKEGEADDAA